MCGLFGYVGTKSPSIDKLKILGILNDRRGGDSCGIGMNGEVIVGVDKIKLFEDFSALNPIGLPSKKNSVVIGHTRKSTAGANTVENAHPFLFTKDDGSWDFIGAHNGTVTNWVSFFKERGYYNESWKVDSKCLLYAMYKKDWDILSQYKGAAALIFTYADEPNTLYCYKGASYDKMYDKDITWERPLHYLDTGSGFYVSSIEKSLQIINNGSDKNIGWFAGGYLWKLTGDKMEKIDVGINRGWTKNYFDWETYQRRIKGEPKETEVINFSHAARGEDQNDNGDGEGKEDLDSLRDKADFKTREVYSQRDGQYTRLVRVKEKVPHAYVVSGKVYFQEGKYRRYGHDLTGTYFINPWTHEVVRSHKLGHMLHFYKGYMTDSEVAIEAIKDCLRDPSNNHVFKISEYLDYPICRESECYWHKGHIAKGEHTPLFSFFTYKFNKGALYGLIPLPSAFRNTPEMSVLNPDERKERDEAAKAALEDLKGSEDEVLEDIYGPADRFKNLMKDIPFIAIDDAFPKPPSAAERITGDYANDNIREASCCLAPKEVEVEAEVDEELDEAEVKEQEIIDAYMDAVNTLGQIFLDSCEDGIAVESVRIGKAARKCRVYLIDHINNIMDDNLFPDIDVDQERLELFGMTTPDLED